MSTSRTLQGMGIKNCCKLWPRMKTEAIPDDFSFRHIAQTEKRLPMLVIESIGSFFEKTLDIDPASSGIIVVSDQES